MKNILLSHIIQVEKGKETSLLLTKQGHLYAKGKISWFDHKSENLESKNWTQIQIETIKYICLKTSHALLISSNEQVYSFGKNDKGQLGRGKVKNHEKLGRVSLFNPAKMVYIGMGKSSFVLCKNNCLYAFGSNTKGKLGVGSYQDYQCYPTLVSFFLKKSTIVDVQCGLRHSIVLLQDGSLYAMGAYSCCGNPLGNIPFDHHVPIRVSINKPFFFLVSWVRYNNEQFIKSICVNSSSTIVETKEGEWYAFGDATFSSSHIGKKICLLPQRVDFVFPSKVKKLISTKYNFALLDFENQVYILETNHSNPKWTFYKSQIVNIQSSEKNLIFFTILPYSFSHKKWTDVCFE